MLTPNSLDHLALALTISCIFDYSLTEKESYHLVSLNNTIDQRSLDQFC